MASRYLEPYNPRAYVPGGSSVKKAKAIQTQGRMAPVPKMSNPYVRPLPGGGSGSVSSLGPSFSPAGLLGASAQSQRARVAAPSFSFNTNYESDPVLARIKAIGQQTVSNAQSEAAKLRKQAILDTGLTDIGQEIGVDQDTLTAAQNNSQSLLAALNRESEMKGRELDESLNQDNLFWSGARANKLGELSRSRADAQAGLARDLRFALGGIDSGLLEAQAAQALREQEELERVAAAQREADLLAAIQRANDAATAAQNGSGIESGLGGTINAPPGVNGQPSGGVTYAPGPTPQQVQNMIDIGVDPATGIYAPQPTTIHGPNNMPEMFGGEPTSVPMPNISAPAGWDTDQFIRGPGSPVSLNESLATAPPEVAFQNTDLPTNLGPPDPWMVALGLAGPTAPNSPSNLTQGSVDGFTQSMNLAEQLTGPGSELAGMQALQDLANGAPIPGLEEIMAPAPEPAIPAPAPAPLVEALAASVAANPEASFGPSPYVDYSSLWTQAPAPEPVYYAPPPPPPPPAPDPYLVDNLAMRLALKTGRDYF